MLTAIASRLLGAVDGLYYVVSELGGGKKGTFFDQGYGDVETSRALRVEILGPIKQSMLDPSLGSDAPTIARPVIKNLDLQPSLSSPNTDTKLTTVKASFESPLATFLPEESKACHIQILKPPAGTTIIGVAIMLPATGDQGFSLRRKLYADALATRGVIGIIVSAPFYGKRKPAAQQKWFLRRVHDSFIQAIAVSVEAACLLHWAKRAFPQLPLAVTGISYGGAMAGLTSKWYPGDLAVVPYMGCAGPGLPFAYGVLRHSVAWKALQSSPLVREIASKEDWEALPIRERLRRYCDFFTDVTEVERYQRQRCRIGCRVVHTLQAKHDGFVFFDDGAGFHKSLEAAVQTDRGSVKFTEMVGGHVTGFLWAKARLVPAVVSALTELKQLQTQRVT